MIGAKQKVVEYVRCGSEEVVSTGSVTVYISEPVGRMEYNRNPQVSCSYSMEPIVHQKQTPEVKYEVRPDAEGRYWFEPVFDGGGKGSAYEFKTGDIILLLFDFKRHNFDGVPDFHEIVPHLIEALEVATEHIAQHRPDRVCTAVKEH